MAGAAADEVSCANCGVPLRGEFCHACGQRSVDLEASIWKLIREALAEIFEADGRLASTLVPFFFRPGHLVKEFIAGRRASYTSPVRIYVFAVLVCFFALGLASANAGSELMVSGEGVYLVDPDSDGAKRLSDREQDETSDDIPDVDMVGEWLAPGIHKLQAMDPEDARQHFVDKIYDVVPKVLLLLVPLLALVLKLAWLRHSMVEHLLFSLNLHSVGMVVLALSIPLGSDTVAVVATSAAVSLHGVVGARRIYDHGWLGTIVRSVSVGAVYFVLFIFGVAASALMAVAMA